VVDIISEDRWASIYDGDAVWDRIMLGSDPLQDSIPGRIDILVAWKGEGRSRVGSGVFISGSFGLRHHNTISRVVMDCLVDRRHPLLLDSRQMAPSHRSVKAELSRTSQNIPLRDCKTGSKHLKVTKTVIHVPMEGSVTLR